MRAFQDEDDFLDRYLDECLDALGRGQQLRAPEDLEPQSELARRARAIAELARAIAVVRAPVLPRVRGYAITREVGRGASARVFLAKHEALDRRVALKVWTATGDPVLRARMLREARQLAAIEHPNIVRIYDVVERVGEEEEAFALALEFIEGPTVAQLIQCVSEQDAPPRLDRVEAELGLEVSRSKSYVHFCLTLTAQIARALEELHSRGLVHRDIKPANLVLQRDASPVVLDFGLATDAHVGLTQSGVFRGTMAYAAPEQLHGIREEIGPRSDIYSLGVVLWELLALERPFRETSIARLLDDIECARRPSLTSRAAWVPRHVETIAERALAPESALRYSSAAELADDLERVLRMEAPKARRVPPRVRVKRLFRRQLAPLAMIAALACAFALLWAFTQTGASEALAQARQLAVRARAALLDPMYSEAVFVAMSSSRREAHAELPDYTRALVHYDAAVAALPTDWRLRQERSVILRLLREGSITLHPDAFARAAPRKLRALGLLAYLQREPELVALAIAQRDRAQADPLVDAIQSRHSLATGQITDATILLEQSWRRFPQMGFLGVELADCLVRSGELTRARQLLDRAVAAGCLDDFGTHRRVRADLAAASGDFEGAMRQYEDLLRDHQAPTIRVHYAQMLSRWNSDREALTLLVELHERRPNAQAVRRAIFASLSKLWMRRSAPAQRALLERAIRTDPPFKQALARLAWVVLSESRTKRENPATLDRPISVLDLQPLPLAALCFTMEILRMPSDTLRRIPTEWKVLATRAALLADTILARFESRGRTYWRLSMRALLGVLAAASATIPASGDLRAQLHTKAEFYGAAGEEMGLSAAVLGDIDGDTVPDFAVALQKGLANTEVVVLSGKCGRRIYTLKTPTSDDWFGLCVAALRDLDGDGTRDLLVGAPGSYTASTSGSASLYSGRTGKLVRTWSGSATHDAFGWSVAGIGDVDGDGSEDLAIGAPMHPPVGNARGGYVRVVSGKTGATISTLRGKQIGDSYGFSVSGIGDADADGRPDLVVGAYRDDAGGREAGRVALISGRSFAEIRAWTGTTGDELGLSVADAGDVDGDGRHDLVAGSYPSTSTRAGGKILVASARTGRTIHVFKSNLPQSQFGRYVTTGGDVDGDGQADVLASYAADATRSGTLDVFSGKTGLRLRTIRGRVAKEGFGLSSFGIAGDFDGDGRPELYGTLLGSERGGAKSGGFRVVSMSPRDFQATPTTLSIAQGGRQDFELDAGRANAVKLYLVLGSASGTSPGVQLGSLRLPLNFDAYTSLTLTTANAWIVGGLGTFDANGRASASLTLPSGLATQSVELNHAYIIFSRTLQSIEAASQASRLCLR